MCLSPRALLCASMLCLSVAAPLVAQAQETSARETLMFVTREVVRGPEARDTSFWWSAKAAPKTSLDQTVEQHMSAVGVKARWPAANAPIAQSYRRAHMPPSNAAALTGVLGAERAVVGSVVIDVLAPKGQLGQVGARAVGRVMLVSAGQTTFSKADVVLVRHTSYASTQDEAVARAEAMVGKGIAGQMARRVMRKRTKVGVGVAERPIVIQNAGTRANIERIKQRLVGVERVGEVQVIWAAHGHIALVINPKVKDNEDLLEQAERTLLSDEFAPTQAQPGFTLQRAQPGGPLRVVVKLQESLGQPATP